MKYLFIFFLLLNTSCFYSDTEFKTSGLKVYSEGPIDPKDIDFVVKATEEEVQKYYPEVINLPRMFSKKKANVKFVRAKMYKDCDKYPKEIVACRHSLLGVIINDKHMLLQYFHCLGTTAFAHEILHFIEKHYLDISADQRKDHATPHFFQNSRMELEERQQTIEYSIKRRLICNLEKCNNTYLFNPPCEEK